MLSEYNRIMAMTLTSACCLRQCILFVEGGAGGKIQENKGGQVVTERDGVQSVRRRKKNEEH